LQTHITALFGDNIINIENPHNGTVW